MGAIDQAIIFTFTYKNEPKFKCFAAKCTI